MFRCGSLVRRVKDERGTKEGRGRTDALASKEWVRMEESGRVDDEGRPILERVDLMEAFFAGVHRSDLKIKSCM